MPPDRCIGNAVPLGNLAQCPPTPVQIGRLPDLARCESWWPGVYVPGFEVLADRCAVDTELSGELEDGSASLVGRNQLVDLGRLELAGSLAGAGRGRRLGK